MLINTISRGVLMAILLKKEVYSDYTIELNELDLRLIIEGLNKLYDFEQITPDVPSMSYTHYLLEELKEMKSLDFKED